MPSNPNPNIDPFDACYRPGYDAIFFPMDESFDSECGVPRFDPQTLRTRVVDRPGGYEPYSGLIDALKAVVAEYGEVAYRHLSILLVEGMTMGHHRDEHGYEAVDALVEAAKDALESGRTAYNFDRKLELHRKEIVSAGLFGWMAPGDTKYGVPPLLAAAMLLDDDPRRALRAAFDLADWLTDVVSEGYWEHLGSPADPMRVVRRFLEEPARHMDL